MTTMSPTQSAIEWRQLGRYLWTGRRDGAPAGMVEQGRWFMLSDEHGDPAGRYRTLAQAQAAAGLPPEERVPLQVRQVRRTLAPPLIAAAIALSSGVAMGSAALAVLAGT